MTTTEILKYMRTNGYDIGFNAISYGLKVIDNLKKNDKDYEVLINKLSSIDLNETHINKTEEQRDSIQQLNTLKY